MLVVPFRTPRGFVVVGAIEKDADDVANRRRRFLRPRRRVDDGGADLRLGTGGDILVVVACVRVFPLAKDHHPQKRHAAGRRRTTGGGGIKGVPFCHTAAEAEEDQDPFASRCKIRLKKNTNLLPYK